MKKRFLGLLLLPLLIVGCAQTNSADNGSYEKHSVETARKTGEIGEFNLTGPANGFVTDTGFTFTWEEASNSDFYQIEIASTLSFVMYSSDSFEIISSSLSEM